MDVTIYHNPRCSKSRETLEILRAQGIEPQIRDYIKDSFKPSEIKEIYEYLKIKNAHKMLRDKEDEYDIAGLTPTSSNDDVFKAIARFPKLLERPIVITPKGARICRPPETVNEIL